MFAFFYNTVILLLAAGGVHGSEGGFTKFYNDWLNIPGFEAWKFINLAIFVAILIYIGKKKLSPKFIARRDAIRAELIKAEEEKQSALKRLTSAEAKLAALENEKAAILKKAREEAEAEKRRLAEQAESDVKKLQEQAAGEVSRVQKQTFAQLRRFSAEESVRLAEEKLRAQIDAQKDAQLVKGSIASIGGLN
jgi:F0F1-type ATP synthase membrane subunit b/b'